MITPLLSDFMVSFWCTRGAEMSIWVYLAILFGPSSAVVAWILVAETIRRVRRDG